MENLKTLKKVKAKKEKFFKNSFLVHILITIFGVSAWLGINAIFVELPLLVNSLPEKWDLPMYIVILIQVANIGPMSYALCRKFGIEFNESRWIFGMLVFGGSVMCFLAIFYDRTLSIVGKEYSWVLFLATLFTALVNCSSSLLFMPYLRHFREIFLVSYFIGEGLSGIIPSIIALVQGTGSSQCDGNSSQPRFSSHYYFICIFVLLQFSLVAFLLLDNLEIIQTEKVGGDKIVEKREGPEEKRKRGKGIREGNGGVKGRDEEEIRGRDEEGIEGRDQVNERSMEESKGRDEEDPEGKTKLTSSLRIYLYILLGVMCLLGNGFLPGIQSYSSLPYGNLTYHLTVTLSQLANPIACFLAMLFPPKNSRIINWLSIISLGISGYVVYLAFESPRPPLQYSVIGQVLVILSWILVMGLISYVKLAIASIFRHETQSENLFRIGIVMQLGSACGAVVSLIVSSFTHLLTSYDSCLDGTLPS